MQYNRHIPHSQTYHDLHFFYRLCGEHKAWLSPLHNVRYRNKSLTLQLFYPSNTPANTYLPTTKHLKAALTFLSVIRWFSATEWIHGHLQNTWAPICGRRNWVTTLFRKNSISEWWIQFEVLNNTTLKYQELKMITVKFFKFGRKPLYYQQKCSTPRTKSYVPTPSRISSFCPTSKSHLKTFVTCLRQVSNLLSPVIGQSQVFVQV